MSPVSTILSKFENKMKLPKNKWVSRGLALLLIVGLVTGLYFLLRRKNGTKPAELGGGPLDGNDVVEQTGALTNPVTLNRSIAKIVTVPLKLDADVPVVFTVKNSMVKKSSVVSAELQSWSGGANDGFPSIHVVRVDHGQFDILVRAEGSDLQGEHRATIGFRVD